MTNITISEGQSAPSFCLPDHAGNTVCLEDFRGKWLVLYFYPRDNTAGCTREAHEFSSLKDDFAAEDASILGVSKDGVKSHQNFIRKQELTITLLSDEDTGVHRQYGVWRTKKNYGREYMGTVRSTFLIDPEGVVVKVWDNVRTAEHAGEVLIQLKKIKESKFLAEPVFK
ncbi:peroxiredoxin [Methanolobus chelungpuianus]|uniref:thioredoxin-dependent peroxiredoxin n=1 Tax=Methanolobus chelungpuianus TaxID=502115 RepID=A0AAE3HBU9_9EURY|nr:peroxiredoxin [Methanolobus chelungpuianus]MCQ6963243.1 peroxiredoxin [Methanolobus chelungpuianus]